MRILSLVKYGQQAACTRHRYLQYLPYLESQGIEVEVSALHDDDYLRQRFASNRVSPKVILSAYIKRLKILLRSRKFDGVVIYGELFPYLPGITEGLLSRFGIHYLYDFDDAFFHQYDCHRLPWVRLLLGRKILRVIRSSCGALAGNEYLASYARRAGVRATILPTVIDVTRYLPVETPRPADAFTIGWIGSPYTVAHLGHRAEALRRFCERYPAARVVLVGSGPVVIPGVKTDIHPWSEASEVEEIQRFDVGIMPLPDEPWTRGKCGFKLIQYMACGIPVVASPVGINREIVDSGRDGYLATTEAEWLSALEELYHQTVKRRTMGERGRKKIVEEYSLHVHAPRLAQTLMCSFS
jgi:glycosyltransferase involved in cell wall biosynthesis